MLPRLLRDKFTDLEEQGAEEPALSVFQMTASLTRSQAAKLFYQICGELPCSTVASCLRIELHTLLPYASWVFQDAMYDVPMYYCMLIAAVMKAIINAMATDLKVDAGSGGKHVLV